MESHAQTSLELVLWISPFQVARITGVSYWHPAFIYFFSENFYKDTGNKQNAWTALWTTKEQKISKALW
jgi:hypothetical protein